MIATLGFAVVAACVLLGALRVVSATSLVHAVLWLGVMLIGTAVLFVMLEAPFLAGVQVLLYAGGVMTLMIFGVMLSRRQVAEDAKPRRRAVAVIPAAILAGGLAASLRSAGSLPVAATTAAPSPADLARRLFGDDVLAFEALSLLLLAAMVGAIIIARRRQEDAGADAVAAAPEERAP